MDVKFSGERKSSGSSTAFKSVFCTEKFNAHSFADARVLLKLTLQNLASFLLLRARIRPTQFSEIHASLQAELGLGVSGGSDVMC